MRFLTLIESLPEPWRTIATVAGAVATFVALAVLAGFVDCIVTEEWHRHLRRCEGMRLARQRAQIKAEARARGEWT